MLLRHLLPLTGAVAVATALAPAAHGADLLTCSGSLDASYAPGLTLTARPTDVTYDEQLTACSVSSEPGITAGGVTTTFRASSLSCMVAPVLGATMPKTITWSDGRISSFASTQTFTLLAGQLVVV